MRNKEFKRHIAYEVLTILGTLALLLFVCRLWPILLLVILGIFIAAMRLLFLSARKVENIPPLLPAARSEPTDQDIRDMAFGSMQRRITELVTADFPNARWVWKTPNAMRNIATGNEVRILLNHAGGYREAIVVIRGLQVCSLTYPHAEEVKMPETENDETSTEETEDDTPQICSASSFFIKAFSSRFSTLSTNIQSTVNLGKFSCKKRNPSNFFIIYILSCFCPFGTGSFKDNCSFGAGSFVSKNI